MIRNKYGGLLLCLLGSASTLGCGANGDNKPSPTASTQHRYGNAQIFRENATSMAIYGSRLATGVDAAAAARGFIAKHAAEIGISEKDLRSSTAPTPVLFDKATGKYRFFLHRFAEERGGVPVFGAEALVLTRNEPGFSAVLAKSQLHRLANYIPKLAGGAINADQAKQWASRAPQEPTLQAITRAALGAQVARFLGGEAVIWAGESNAPVEPRLAVSYIAESANQTERWRVVADAATSEILHRESLILFENVTGSVNGKATPGNRAPQCTPAADAVLKHAQVTAGSATVFTDVTGAYQITGLSSTPVGVASKLAGRYFKVSDATPARESSLSATLTPPGVENFTHNPGATDEFLRAQVNGYVASQQVRDWLLSYHPTYPVIAGQTNFPVLVNRADGYCPGNAWYDGASLNFCAASAEYGNTSFSSVNYHEYGHHIVKSGGSGQGEYGEGMGDVIASLVSDSSGVGFGFFAGQCDTPLRDANNTCQLSASCSTCGSESHDCGNLLSGIVWSIRSELLRTNPTNYRDLLAQLAINSILVHRGTNINTQIAVDFLTLDDNDSDITNGTPHRDQICTGFAAHGITCPALSSGLGITSSGLFTPQGHFGGPFVPGTATYQLRNLGTTPLNYTVTPSVPWLSSSLASGSLAGGATQDVVITVTPAANTLPIGVYSAGVQFVNTTNHGGDKHEPVKLSVGIATPQVIWDMNENPGWTPQGAWQWGPPLGFGGDPNSGATGTNVYGYNLAGVYTPDLSEQHVTTNNVDCSNLTRVSLRFKRWLGVESSNFDHASVGVSKDGVNWTTVWRNPSTSIVDTAWQTESIDISAVADGQATVYVRWTMGATDPIIQLSGWNLDDVEIWGVRKPITSCTTDEQCSDGAYCNGVETCVENRCTSGTPVDCADSVSCTADSCDEATDACVHTPNATVCDNGVFCDGAERCDATTGCTAGTPPCSTTTCDESTDTCVECTTDSQCNDGAYCNGVETCVSNSCVRGTPPCSTTCDESTDTCAGCTTDAQCSDGLFCNGAERCVDHACVPDLAPCPIACDETADVCLACTTDIHCTDEVYCNGTERCVSNACVAGTPPCVDSVSCTVDSCNESTHACQNTPDNSRCSNGLFCDGNETCTTAGCKPGTAPCPSGTSCNESTDTCACVPSCSGKQCGPDGCGGTCGTCPGGRTCNATGQCTSACTGVQVFDQSQWLSYRVGTKVQWKNVLYQCKNTNWCWIQPDNRDGGLGWTRLGPC